MGVRGYHLVAHGLWAYSDALVGMGCCSCACDWGPCSTSLVVSKDWPGGSGVGCTCSCGEGSLASITGR